MKRKTQRKPFVLLLLVCLSGAGWLIAQDAPAPEGSQRTFPSAAAATEALTAAARAHDRAAVHQLFGPEVTNLFTGDQALDNQHFDTFASNLVERCVTVPEGQDKVVLEIGHDQWPFPIPLVRSNGVWFFDTIAGEDEVVNRHIGLDEYYAIGVCRDYVKAQREYRQRASAGGTPRYAARLKSQPGKENGLDWPAAPGAQASPLSQLVAEASLEGYQWSSGKEPHPFHGYFFKILTRQGPAAPGGKKDYVHRGAMTGGFALVAYPVRWGQSGIMTFIVDQDGTVYQRSLGENTPRIAADMKEYNPDSQWTVVKDEGITDVAVAEPNGH